VTVTQAHTETIEIVATPEVVYDLVADVTKATDLSPEARRAEWIGQPAAPVAGARFRGYNRWRGFRWSREVRIVTADRGREFGFETIPGRGIYHDTTTWRYRFEPIETGTRVTESYVFRAPTWLRLMDRGLGRPAALARGMRATLQALKRTAEQGGDEAGQ
jgi:hypothetical protein